MYKQCFCCCFVVYCFFAIKLVDKQLLIRKLFSLQIQIFTQLNIKRKRKEKRKTRKFEYKG